MELKRGQFVTSYSRLAEETGLSISKVRTAMNKFKVTGELTSETTSKFSIITVINYDLYQLNDNQIASKSQSNDNQIATTKKEKKEKKEKKKDTLCKAEASSLFERLWKEYPNKRGKGQVSDTRKKHLLDIGEDELLRAIDRYKADLKKNPWKKAQNGSTFFNSGHVDFLDANYDGADKPKNPIPEPKDKDRFSCLPKEFRDELERSGVIKGQSLFAGFATLEQKKKLQDYGVL